MEAIDNRDQKAYTDPMIGTMLPRRYRITGSLGRGAMSVVYSGVYEPLGQPVAVKLLKSHLVSDQSTFKRFQQEAKTAGALEHPNIVGILDFGVTDQGVPYLIMELVHGISLWQRMRMLPPLGLQEMCPLFAQICDALQYTHERGIIHRDVKPSNIIIASGDDGKDVAKVLDFGIAKLQTFDGNTSVSELTATGEVFGTPLYVSPEQAMGRTLDNRADIYSLGCMLYEAVVGQPIFNGTNAFDVIRMQINNDPIPVDAARPDLKLPPSLIRAVEMCLEKSPGDRYQSMQDVAADLRLAMAEDFRGVYGRQTKGGGVNSTSRIAAAKMTQPEPKAPSTVARPKSRLPIMLFLIVWISGMLTGVLILFVLDLKQKLELASVPTEQMVLSDTGASSKSNPQADEVARASKALTDQQYGVAIEALSKAIPALEQAGPAQRENLANALNLMGIAYYYMRNPAKAAPYLERAYGLDKSLYGAESHACAGVLTNLARVNEMEHNFEKAEKYYRDSLAVSEKVYGRNDKKLTARLQNLAAFLKRRHRTVEAASLERRAQDMK